MLFLLLILPWVSLSGSMAEDSAQVAVDSTVTADAVILADASSCRLSIETVRVSNGQAEDTLDIMLEGVAFEPAGCLLKIGLATGQLSIVDILPGEIIDSCRWEMFSAMPVPPLDADNVPRELWQITALAQTISDTASPPCLAFERPASLARIVVSSAHLPFVADTTAELFFYWEDCRDNAVSDAEGRAICLSDSVTSVLPETYTTVKDRLPTRYGAPGSCINPSAYIKPRRIVDFVNGGIEFRLVLSPPAQPTE